MRSSTYGRRASNHTLASLTLLALVAAAPLAACSRPASAAETAPVTATGLQIQSSDYAADRAAFHSKLLYQGPSPQAEPMPAPPAGVSAVRFPSAGRELVAWVGMPDQRSAHMPVVIFLHGGFAFGLDDYQMAEPFRQAGYVVVTPILRGEDGQAGGFSMFYDEVDDVLAATDFVSRQAWADGSHIFLAGHSVGGTMAMLSGMASSRFRAVAAFSGSPDQIAFTEGQPWSRIVPFDRADPKELQLRSPLAYPGSFKSPTRLFYGTQEAYFRTSTQQLAALAKKAGRDVEAQEFEGDHFGAVPAEIKAAIAFFRSKS
jgi:dipeptidyl aminopeptidase/acylaminoacyl peptidase